MFKKVGHLAVCILIIGALWCSYKYLFIPLTYKNTVFVALAVSREGVVRESNILSAYESVFKEEGIPYRVINVTELLAYEPGQAVDTIPAIVFPDNAVKWIPVDMKQWLVKYVEAGGNAAVIYNAGVTGFDGKFLKKALFTELTGVNYILYEKLKDRSYTKGFIRFENQKQSEFFQIPPGKLKDGNPVNGYSYGNIEYPVAVVEQVNISSGEVRAIAVSKEGESYPAVIARKIGTGNVLYVNLPLGFLKSNSDDNSLSNFMRTFLFKIANIPHLVNDTNNSRILKSQFKFLFF